MKKLSLLLIILFLGIKGWAQKDSLPSKWVNVTNVEPAWKTSKWTDASKAKRGEMTIDTIPEKYINLPVTPSDSGYQLGGDLIIDTSIFQYKAGWERMYMKPADFTFFFSDGAKEYQIIIKSKDLGKLAKIFSQYLTSKGIKNRFEIKK